MCNSSAFSFLTLMEPSTRLILKQPRPSYLIHATILLAVLSLLSQTFAAPTTPLANNATDRLSLLSFKSVLSDPLGALNSWNDTVHYCQWPGVTCSRRHPERVSSLVLENLQLDGPISPSLANLTFLRSLYLPLNNLRGRIPPELFRMPRLQELYLKSNYLDGEIPASFTNSTSIQKVSFTDNLLTGEIPRDIGSLSNLLVLNLGYNGLTGTIPDSLGNLSSLFGIAMQENSLEGSIPDSLGKLTKLKLFQAFNNSLSGSLPSSMFNLSFLQIFSIGYNRIGGSLPPSMFNTLPNIQQLLLSTNQFHGTIPVSLSNASNIGDVELSDNNFSGTIPSALGSLQSLWWLELSSNGLEAREASDWDFITSLTNCSSLQLLDLESNTLGGILPSSIANLSPNLNTFLMGWNQISGGIPARIGNLINLTMLTLNDNNLTGTIPNTIGRLQRLHVLSLAGNRLTGEIPQTISNLTQLNRLELQRNGLNGSIPPGLGSCINLQELDLSQNKLTGSIPREVVMLGSLSTHLDLSSNLLTGHLPAEISNLKNLGGIAVSDNRLSGDIPSSIGDCQSLEYLYMQGNFFQGTIPPSLSNLRGLQVLDLSRNNLSGEIPESLRTLRTLQQLNLSFNNLEGQVPEGGVFNNASAVSIVGNKELCGANQMLHLPTCSIQTTTERKHKWHTVKVIILVLGVLLFIIILAMIALAALHRLKNLRKQPPFESPIEDPFRKVSYAELLKATDGFSSSNLIGRGSFGSVYKGMLESNEGIVAVKVLNLQRRGASKTFAAECETMRHIRHRNLVKIITSCSSVDFQGNDFKALVLKYMPNGNLENWLHPEASQHSELKNLNLIQRLNIAIDVASALDYLHHHGHVPIVHCDLKPSNVLLDEDMRAHVSDFGLARFLSELDSTSNEATRSLGIKGTIGYVAPEYGMGGHASTHGDVYSYGILLLELFTGKRPTNDIFKDGLSLRKYIEMALSQKVLDIVDPSLFLFSDESVVERNAQNTNNVRPEELKCIISVMKIGLSCSKEDPRERMVMGDAIKELHAVRKMYFDLGICEDQ